MTYRALLFNTLVALFFGVHSSTVVAGQRQMPMQMQDMEKEMMEANKAIEEYIASLPPAEQAEFNRQVEEFSQMFENMDDEEFEKFLGEMFTEDQIMTFINGILVSLEIVTASKSDKGKIMKALMPLVKDKADGKLVNKLVDEIIS